MQTALERCWTVLSQWGVNADSGSGRLSNSLSNTEHQRTARRANHSPTTHGLRFHAGSSSWNFGGRNGLSQHSLGLTRRLRRRFAIG